MYQELSKRHHISILTATVFILFGFLLLNIISFIGRVFNINNLITDIIVIALIASMTITVIKRCFVQFKYKLIGEEFIITEIRGKKENVVLNIHKSQILKLEAINSECYKMAKQNKCCIVKKLYNGLKKVNCYYCIYEEDNQKYYFEFEPSQKMLLILNKEKVA